jgi:hypothetical protein
LENHDRDESEILIPLCFLLFTRDVERLLVMAALSLIVCKAANLKYKGLLSPAIIDAFDAL